MMGTQSFKFPKKFLKSSGSTLSEYAILLSFCSLMLVGALRNHGDSLNNAFMDANAAFGSNDSGPVFAQAGTPQTPSGRWVPGMNNGNGTAFTGGGTDSSGAIGDMDGCSEGGICLGEENDDEDYGYGYGY